MFSGNNAIDRVCVVTQGFQCKDEDLQQGKVGEMS